MKISFNNEGKLQIFSDQTKNKNNPPGGFATRKDILQRKGQGYKMEGLRCKKEWSGEIGKNPTWLLTVEKNSANVFWGLTIKVESKHTKAITHIGNLMNKVNCSRFLVLSARKVCWLLCLLASNPPFYIPLWCWSWYSENHISFFSFKQTLCFTAVSGSQKNWA